MLCGDGVRGCHGAVEDHDKMTLAALGKYIARERPDIIEHLRWRKGEEGAREWLRLQFGLDS